MGYFFILTILVSLSSRAYGSCIASTKTLLDEIAEASNKNCSEEKDFHKHLSSYAYHEKNSLCDCLNTSPFKSAVVNRSRVNDFRSYEYDQSFRSSFKHDFEDMYSTFVKFDNLLESKEHLGNIMDSKVEKKLCDLPQLIQDIKDLKKKSDGEDDDCDPPDGFFENRLEGIFGTTNLDKVLPNLKEKKDSIGNNSCLSKNLYFDMRSSPGAAHQGLTLLLEAEDIAQFRAAFDISIAQDKKQFKDLITYDPLFSLAYRDENFFNAFKKIHNKRKEDPNNRLFDIYNDKRTLKAAFKSLNQSCQKMGKNLKTFLCAKHYPVLHPTALNLHLKNHLKEKGTDPEEKKNLVNYLTWDFSCNEERVAVRYKRGWKFWRKGAAVDRGDKEEKLNKYLSESALIKNNTQNSWEEGPDSEYSQFNKMFCPKDKKNITMDDLPILTKNFFNNKANGQDLKNILASNAENLGLEIVFDDNGLMTFKKPGKDANNDVLPNISRGKWEKFIRPALEGKLSEEEITQLYHIIEMQTNRKFTQIEDLKAKVVRDNEQLKDLSLKDILAIKEGKNPTGTDPVVAERIRKNYLAKDSNVKSKNYSEKLFFKEVTSQEVKSDAEFNSRSKKRTDPDTVEDFYVYESQSQQQQGQSTGGSSSRERTPGENPNGNSNPQNSPKDRNSEFNEYSYATPQNSPSGVAPVTATSSHSGANRKSLPESNPFKNVSSVNSAKSLKKGNKKSQDDDIKKMNEEIAAMEAKLKSLGKNKTNNSGKKKNRSSSKENSSHASNYSSPASASSSSVIGRVPAGNATLSNNPSQSEPYSPASLSDELSSDSSALGGGEGGSLAAGDAGSRGIAGAVAKGEGNGSSTGSGEEGYAPGEKASSESEEEEVEDEVKLIYEFEKVVPHKVIKMSEGKVDKVVLLLHLEGKRFQTVEETSSKIIMRTYDFVPEGKLKDIFEKEMKTSEMREKAFEKFFLYPRNKATLKDSKHYAKYTKQVNEEVINKKQFNKLQKKIMSDKELKDTIQEAMANFK